MTGVVVLHVLEALETGCARHLVDLVTHTGGVRHEVLIPRRRVGGVTDTAALGHIEAAGGVVHLVEMRRSPLNARNAIALAATRALVRRRHPDVVHGHSSIGGVLARVAALRAPVARVYTPNGLAAGRVASAVERALGRLTDRVVAVSASEHDEIVRRGLVPAERVTTIPNGIDVRPPAPADLRTVIGVGPDVTLVGTMGRLCRQKNPVLAVEAFRLLGAGRPGLHFVVVGEGPLASEFERAVAAAGIGDRLHWVRQLPEASRYLHELDVFVLGSRFEGGPYAPLEAIRAGVPVVLTDVVGSRDVVISGVSGLLVPEGDAVALAGAVGTLLDEPGRRDRLRVAAQARLRDHFDVESMGDSYRELYEDLARHPGAGRRGGRWGGPRGGRRGGRTAG